MRCPSINSSQKISEYNGHVGLLHKEVSPAKSGKTNHDHHEVVVTARRRGTFSEHVYKQALYGLGRAAASRPSAINRFNVTNRLIDLPVEKKDQSTFCSDQLPQVYYIVSSALALDTIGV